MSIVHGSFSVICSQCGTSHSFDATESDFENTGSEERAMGRENQYTWEITFDCDCGNETEIVYDVW